MNIKINGESRQLIAALPFSVRARVAMQLGRQSISDSVIAILELVKNSYDADAENVRVHFVNLPQVQEKRDDWENNEDDTFLIIEDDGAGMSLEDLTDSWMIIGSENKVVNRRSKNKQRILIGEKGLGRLGLDRLCKITSVQTFTEDSDTGIELVVRWKKYEAEASDKPLESIKHELFELPFKQLIDPNSGESYYKQHGTRLVLEELQDDWDQENIEKLQKELSLLVSPFAGINDFRIWLYIDGTTDEITSQDMLEVAEWKLISKLYEAKDSNGKSKWQVHHIMTARDGTQYELSVSWEKALPYLGKRVPLCGPLQFEMYFIPRLAVKELDFSRAQIKQFMDANQGIRIYRDHFRVKPYGEPTGEGDWLNLSFYRQQNPQSRGKRGWRVGYNQVVGAIFIERQANSALLDQTNREGLIEGPAYDDLVQFARHAIEWFERRDTEYIAEKNEELRVEQVREQASESSKAAGEAAEQFTDVLNELFEQIPVGVPDEEHPTEEIRSQLIQAANLVSTRVQEARDAQNEMGRLFEEKTAELEREKDTLANLASLGILAVAFGHETIGYSNLVVNNTVIVQHQVEKILQLSKNAIAEQVLTSLGDVHYGAARIQTFADFMLKNVRRDKRKRVNVYIDKLVNDVLDVFQESLETKRNIIVIRELPHRRMEPIRAFYIDWESILVNFITNSIWALENVPSEERKIRVKVFVADSELHLLFADSGCGIAADTIDRILEPTFSTKRDKRGRHIGTGMGLTIVNNLVKSYDGAINVESPSDLGGAQFHIKIPYVTDQRGRNRQ